MRLPFMIHRINPSELKVGNFFRNRDEEVCEVLEVIRSTYTFVRVGDHPWDTWYGYKAHELVQVIPDGCKACGSTDAFDCICRGDDEGL